MGLLPHADLIPPPTDFATQLADAIEAEDAEETDGLVPGALAAGWGRTELKAALMVPVANHFLDVSHAAIYQSKVFDLLHRSGWHHAPDLLAGHIVASVNGTREDVLPTWRRWRAQVASAAPRDADGVPVGAPFTLRADASGYLSFPKAPRTALPLAPADTADGVLSGAAADIGLLAIDATGLGTVSGTVKAGEDSGGALVIAGGSTGISDRDGSFVVFNVAPGSADLSGYLQGVNLDPVTVEVEADHVTEGVVLDGSGSADGSVSGTVQIVHAPGGAVTSVILVAEDAFNPDAIRGEAPAGLRAGDVTGDWSMEGLPNGRWVVLAAFENDDLFRDPDTSIGGTQIVMDTVSGGAEAVDGFKVTEALEVLSPGADGLDLVSGDVHLEWVDDSSEDE